MNLHGATALVTGAASGLGREFAEELVRRGARVYATARNPERVDIPGARVLALDITDPESVASAAARAGDVDLLINNGGVSFGARLVDGDLALIRQTFDTHLWGTLAMIRAFAPVLARNGGGAILNVMSATAWLPFLGNSAYSAAKSAEWGLTNNVRLELADQGTLVTGLLFGPTATEAMRAFADAADLTGALATMLNDPAEIVRAALDGIAAGQIEILPDALGVAAKAGLADGPRALELDMLTPQ